MFTCAEEERDMMPPRGEVEKNILMTHNVECDHLFYLPSLQLPVVVCV